MCGSMEGPRWGEDALAEYWKISKSQRGKERWEKHFKKTINRMISIVKGSDQGLESIKHLKIYMGK